MDSSDLSLPSSSSKGLISSLLSPAKHPNKWAIAKRRFNKSFHYVPPLSKSHKFTYPNQGSELFTCFFALQQYIFIEFQIPINENT